MNKAKRTSMLLDMDRAGLSLSRVLLKRGLDKLPRRLRQKKAKPITARATRAYWRKFVGVQLRPGRKVGQ